MLAANRQAKSTEATVFIRFMPPTSTVTRHELEDLFSQVGPVKKCAVVKDPETKVSSYAFVRFVHAADAVSAAPAMNGRTLKTSLAESIALRTELASSTSTAKAKKAAGAAPTTTEKHKKTARIIIRNLSFYAKESHVRNALERFGSIDEVHLPNVIVEGKKQSRGFGFVTFSDKAAAQQCIKESNGIEICKRQVQLAWSLQKDVYEKQKKANVRNTNGDNDDDTEMLDPEQDDTDSNNDDDEANEHNVGSSDVDDKSASEMDNQTKESSESEGEESRSSEHEEDDNSKDKQHEDSPGTIESLVKTPCDVSENRSLFVRNLPFDCSRHDLFDLFRKHGNIEGIYLTKDKATGLNKGTAFIVYSNAEAAQRALSYSGSQPFAPQQQASESEGDGYVLKERKLLVNLAVDKDTAATLKQTDIVKVSKDKRNLYLKTEGRVDENWDDLPETDKLKRQNALSEKNTKLRSPLFFINPTRLSIRNLAKHVDEAALKKLCVDATVRGLQRKLVSLQDQVSHWKASGEMNTREILEKAEQLGDEIIPAFDIANVKKFIPSVFISRDFAGKKTEALSRGFGFAEFNHHIHALACLRELNNNTLYSERYTAGGKVTVEKLKRKSKSKVKREDPQNALVPRLIVEFTVENKVKAKQQSLHREAQVTNQKKQKV